MVYFVVLLTYRYVFLLYFFFFFKQKTAYEMRISDWSSDVCSSDLLSFRTRDRPWETTRRSASLQRRATPARPACSPNPYRSNPTVPRRSTNLSATGSSAAAG